MFRRKSPWMDSMNLKFTKSKYFYCIIITVLIFMSIFLPHGLKGYPNSLIFFICAYINKSKKISLLAGGFPRDKIKNWERLMKFEKTFFIVMGIALLFSQILVDYNPKNTNMATYVLIPLGILFITYVFVKIE